MCSVLGGDGRSPPDACPRAHYGVGHPREGWRLSLARSDVSLLHYDARSAAPDAPALAVNGYTPARGGHVRPPVAFVADPGVGQQARACGEGGVGRRINVIGTTTSALLIVIVCSTATCWSRVTRIVYVPGANAIPGAYGWDTLRASVTVIRLSAGVGSTVRRKVRGGGEGSGCQGNPLRDIGRAHRDRPLVGDEALPRDANRVRPRR